MSLFSHSPRLSAPQIFVSYSAEQRAVSERLALTLMGMGYRVFYDQHRIAAGESFTRPILDALDRCDLFVFLVSSRSVAKGHFALSELGMARRRWPHPAGRVLAVMVDETPMDALPAYLRVTSVLQPQGDVVADTVTEVDRMARSLEHQRGTSGFLGAVRFAGMVVKAAGGAAAVASLLFSLETVCPPGRPDCPVPQALLHVPLLVLAPTHAAFMGTGALARWFLPPAAPQNTWERGGPRHVRRVFWPRHGSAGAGSLAGSTSSAGRVADTVTFVVRCVRGRPTCIVAEVIYGSGGGR